MMSDNKQLFTIKQHTMDLDKH